MRSRPGKVRLKTTPEDLLASGVLLPDVPPGRTLDLAAAFGNNRPVEMEIGPGKGAFILRRAGERPEINFLGVEWVRAYAQYVADRALRNGLTNVRSLCADAGVLLARQLPAESLWRIHVYFPDPWPKRRHHVRRLISASFLAGVRRALKPGGWIGMVTDHDDYFAWIRRALDVTDGLAEVPFRALGDPDGWLVGSNFERKYAGTDRTFHAAAAMRLR
jgi:tRNA (guanine-N7-)-methyltransferase